MRIHLVNYALVPPEKGASELRGEMENLSIKNVIALRHPSKIRREVKLKKHMGLEKSINITIFSLN